MAAAKPVHEIRLGLIKVAIWRSDTRAGERHNVTAYRLYKDVDWKQSQHFGRDDILLLIKALDMAHTWIYHQANGIADAQEQ